jgi:hypothetical protein
MTQPATKLYPKWKEQLIYEEGPNSHAFECGWGVSPPHVSVPAAEDWDAVMPPFLRGRRDEIVKMLREKSGHVVDEDPPRASRR